MKKEFTISMDPLSSTTLFKQLVLKIPFNRSVLKEEKNTLRRHQNELDNSLKEKNENNIFENLNTIVTNLTKDTKF